MGDEIIPQDYRPEPAPASVRCRTIADKRADVVFPSAQTGGTGRRILGHILHTAVTQPGPDNGSLLEGHAIPVGEPGLTLRHPAAARTATAGSNHAADSRPPLHEKGADSENTSMKNVSGALHVTAIPSRTPTSFQLMCSPGPGALFAAGLALCPLTSLPAQTPASQPGAGATERERPLSADFQMDFLLRLTLPPDEAEAYAVRLQGALATAGIAPEPPQFIALVDTTHRPSADLDAGPISDRRRFEHAAST